MKGLLQRIRFRRRSTGPAPQETQPTVVAPAVAPPSETLPAGVAPQAAAGRPSFRERGRLRRRLRYLRRVRELGFRDLGGLVFDLHRFGRQGDDLVRGKLAALDAVDRELRALERVLDDRRDVLELREPGIAACPRCGALHASEDRFCPSCGTTLRGPLAIGDVAAHATEPAGPTPVTAALATPPPTLVPHEGGAAATVDQPTQAMPAVEAAAAEVATPSEGGAPAGAAEGAPAEVATPSGGEHTAPATAAPAGSNGAPGEEHREGEAPPAVTSGDPLAQRERQDS